MRFPVPVFNNIEFNYTYIENNELYITIPLFYDDNIRSEREVLILLRRGK